MLLKEPKPYATLLSFSALMRFILLLLLYYTQHDQETDLTAHC